MLVALRCVGIRMDAMTSWHNRAARRSGRMHRKMKSDAARGTSDECSLGCQ